MKNTSYFSIVALFALVVPVLSLLAFAGQGVPQVSAGGAWEEPVSTPSQPVSTPTQPGNAGGNNNGVSTNAGGSPATGTSAAHPQGCGDTRPVGVSDLFQINRDGAKATLYFTPVHGASSYHVVFGHKDGDERFGGISMVPSNNNGVQTIVVDHLSPRKTYSFKVVPANGCAAGDSSSWLTATGKGLKFSAFKYFKKK
ncbi:MAG TPA: hypothetical protein VD999_03640 [Vitreimonas sp.]|nr:hypothetical protein [Vitreimonas sp.]